MGRHEQTPGAGDAVVAGALQDEGFQRTAGKLDPGTRSLLTAFLKMALPRLVRVRRPRDLRRWTKDAVVVAATHSYLVPAIDGLMESAARGALPIGGRVPSHLSATVTGVAGPVAATAMVLLSPYAVLHRVTTAPNCRSTENRCAAYRREHGSRHASRRSHSAISSTPRCPPATSMTSW